MFGIYGKFSVAFAEKNRDKTILETIIKPITYNEYSGWYPHNWSLWWNMSLNPTKINNNATPGFKKRNLVTRFATRKKRERKPRIAKILEKKTIKGSRETAKIAGIESNAKIKSENSIIIKTKNSGVKKVFPCPWTKTYLLNIPGKYGYDCLEI